MVLGGDGRGELGFEGDGGRELEVGVGAGFEGRGGWLEKAKGVG